MKKNKVVTSIVVSAMACTAVLSGCTISTNNVVDMQQVVATVNITKSGDSAFADQAIESGITDYTSVITDAEITKMDLVLYYFNNGSTYINNGYTYAETFELLLSGLAGNKVLTQYATLYLLYNKVATSNGALTAASVVADYKNMDEVAQLEYLLDADEINLAKYQIYSSFNSTIDDLEDTDATDDSDEERGSDTRTTPTNVDTEQDDYYPYTEENGVKTLNYGIYTGFQGFLLKDSGTYQDDKKEGTTKSTRKKAYNSFITTLSTNGFLEADDDISDITSLSYFKQAYVSQLQSAVLNKYYDLFEDSLSGAIQGDNETLYVYLQNRYEELLKMQSRSYTDSSSFESAMDSYSDTSLILYAPNTTLDTEADENNTYGTFGYVYNILLPFSDAQSVTLSALQSERDSVVSSSDNPTKEQIKSAYNTYYYKRNQLLKQISTTDQRSAWFNGATEYAFDATDKVAEWYGKDSGKNYLFFENNLTNNDQYKVLDKYTGKYAYNGKVVKTKDGTYQLTPNKLTIDDMLNEFVAYVDYVLGNTTTTAVTKTAGYYDQADVYETGSLEDIDYSNFVYAKGDFNLASSFNPTDLLNTQSASYKAMSAVNELQYAYTTDTSVLSQYVGYSVSAYTTSYIKEFEYAAQTAVKNGVGSFVVCAGDYGWHLIYVTYTFDFNGGNIYGATPDWANNIDVEGTFENLFFESIKSSDLSNAESNRQSVLLQLFYNDNTVTKYQSRYQDLLDLDSSSSS